MLFQTQVYILVFLPAAVAAYYLAAGQRVLRQWILVAASLVFYGWWDVRFVPLVVGQITLTWLLAILHQRTGRRGVLVAGVVLNLASIATFKYLDFLLSSVAALVGLELPAANIVLPIGISFFSFQLISYLIDRMRGDAPIYPYRPFALFVLLFPHLIAGPIVRHNELIPQFDQDPRRNGCWMRISAGLIIFTVGFAKKVLLADRLSPLADPLYAKAATRALDFGEAWTAALAFSLQLFLDFSAYTEMAIGSALLFGLLLPENFRRPYISVNLQDFWRRWHISLSLFIRDYLYIPLGGSRRGWPRYVYATIVSMAICGLWHGAGWTYVVWGLWHGLGLVIYRGWKTLARPLPVAAGWLLTMLFVLVGWVIFRSPSFTEAGSILASLSGANGLSGPLQSSGLIVSAAIVSVLVPSAHQIKDRLLQPNPVYAVAGALLAVFCVLEVGKGAPVNFIYFQF
jgi:D-alanyl-lipoteichoic acid acyltransferase DltB (MBOAT superfamily)